MFQQDNSWLHKRIKKAHDLFINISFNLCIMLSISLINIKQDELFLFKERELTGAEKPTADETDIDAEELPLPDSTMDEFSRGVTDLDAAKKEEDVTKDKKVSSCSSLAHLIIKSMSIINHNLL